VIVGIGVQFVDTARFEATLDRFGERVRDRLFTAEERAYSASSGSHRTARGAQSLAARFAAKLATRQALSAPSLPWREIEVIRAAAQRVAGSVGVDCIALTLTHDAQWCIGQVILESHA
jgi:holo-[acyl-carrier protein] synthase